MLVRDCARHVARQRPSLAAPPRTDQTGRQLKYRTAIRGGGEVDVLDQLDAPAVRRWSIAAADALAEHQDEIDELNVFPVPDRDTGTNLALTLRAACDALSADAASTAAAALRTLARGAVLGARGNSGVIVSQILRGFASAVDAAEACDAPRLQAALREGAEHAYAAVAEPLEGTILTVARAAAEASAAVPAATLAAVVEAAVAGAADALNRTTEQLPALARAGVVDAGGRGLVVLLDSLASVVTGMRAVLAPPRRSARPLSALLALREAGSETFGYEVQYLLEADDDAVTVLREQLARMGDSLVVVGTGDGLWNVHVHVNDVGAAIESGVEAGRPHRVTVVRFADQVRAPLRSGVAVVAVAPGEGLAHLFEGEGVRVVGGTNPSTAEVLAAVHASGAAQVVLLPNASRVTGVVNAAAEQARDDGIEVAVVPTRSPVQGLAAVAVHDAARRFGDDVVAMAEAAAATRWAEVTVAQREALTSLGRVQAGDVVGLIDGEVVEIGTSVRDVALDTLDRLLGVGGELITIIAGKDTAPELAAEVQARIAEAAPFIEVAVFDGGQPDYPLLLGVE
jgi:DAK2 domain fusion protein YloV